MKTHQKHVLPQLFVSVVSEEKQNITEFFPGTYFFNWKTCVGNQLDKKIGTY